MLLTGIGEEKGGRSANRERGGCWTRLRYICGEQRDWRLEDRQPREWFEMADAEAVAGDGAESGVELYSTCIRTFYRLSGLT